jgi:RNA-binding protein
MDREAIHHLKPTIWIGKRGCTADIIEEIKRQIKDRKLIKVRWLKNTEIEPEAIAIAAGADLVEVRGRTVVLTEARTRPQKRDPRNV